MFENSMNDHHRGSILVEEATDILVGRQAGIQT